MLRQERMPYARMDGESRDEEGWMVKAEMEREYRW